MRAAQVKTDVIDADVHAVETDRVWDYKADGKLDAVSEVMQRD